MDASGAILVGHDGSLPAATAVRWAARLAERLSLPLLVVRSWALSSAPRPSTWTAGYVPPLTDFEDAVRQRLEHDVAGLDLPADCRVSCHVVHGQPDAGWWSPRRAPRCWWSAPAASAASAAS